ncbi:hypothetical protein ABT297_04125 [Dactylosporangium sp. NPDC000555]|uniref:hypothetical protein n=1 Tax=Dactylosporangium sp. NPDC000555 TaxID=3154260 RepID=UPI0033258E89
MTKRRHQVIDGELVDAPRALKADARQVHFGELSCATHPQWLGCQLQRTGCIQYIRLSERDERTWTQRLTTFRVVDHRRAR